MSDDRLRPIPGDPSAVQVESMLDVRGEAWVLAAPGEYATYAVETFKADGSGWQRVIALEWPGRVNHSDELRGLRLLLAAEDAVGLAGVLLQTAEWLLAAEELGR